MKNKTLGKIVSLMLVAMMLVALTSCSKNSDEANTIDTEVRDFDIFAGISSLSPERI